MRRVGWDVTRQHTSSPWIHLPRTCSGMLTACGSPTSSHDLKANMMIIGTVLTHYYHKLSLAFFFLMTKIKGICRKTSMLLGHSMPNQPNFWKCPTWPTQKILKKIMLHPLPEKLLYSDFQRNRSNTFRDMVSWKLKHFFGILKIAVLVNFAEPYLQKYLHYNAETYSQ